MKATHASNHSPDSPSHFSKKNSKKKVRVDGKVKASHLTMSSLSLCIAVACNGVLSVANPVYANGPKGGVIIDGSGDISKVNATTTLINQTSQQMAINWDSYNIASNERVQYIQPNSQSVSLNNILSSNGSVIAGNIDANGKVILVNPNGIVFTQSSTLNIGSLVASNDNTFFAVA